MGLFGGAIMFFIGLVFLGLLIYLIVLLSRNAKGQASVTGNGGSTYSAAPNVNDALAILNERYARGEIDDEEYARKKAALVKL